MRECSICNCLETRDPHQVPVKFVPPARTHTNTVTITLNTKPTTMAFVTPTRFPSSLGVQIGQPCPSLTTPSTDDLRPRHTTPIIPSTSPTTTSISITTTTRPTRTAASCTTTVCTLDGRQLSTGRHRRLYDFFSAASAASAATAKKSPGKASGVLLHSSSTLSAQSSDSAVTVEYTTRLDSVTKQLLLRNQLRQQQNRAVQAQRMAEWAETLQRLSNKSARAVTPAPAPAPAAPVVEIESEPEISSSSVSSAPPTTTAPTPTPAVKPAASVGTTPDVVDAPPATPPQSVAEVESSAPPAPEPAAPVEPAPWGSASTVSDLYGASSTSSRAVKSVETTPRQASTDSVSSLYSPPSPATTSTSTEAPTDSVSSIYSPPPPAAPASSSRSTGSQETELNTSTSSEAAPTPQAAPAPQAASATVETPAEEEASAEGEVKPLGQALLEVITEGVPNRPGDEEKEEPAPTSASAAPAEIIDKSQIIYLVDTGKVKNLTVMKLRRLLSAHNLKTSGRKSELIARLTSFARAK